jgi:hypothetical protein
MAIWQILPEQSEGLGGGARAGTGKVLFFLKKICETV